MSISGCQTLHHDKDKQEAQQHWQEVRGRFKYQLARQQYEGGLFSDAVITATEAISLDPKEANAYAVLARANLELGQPAAATAALDAAEQSGLTTSALTYMRGVIFEQRGDLTAALDRYRQARSHDPFEVDYFLAEIEVQIGRAHV